MHGNLCVRRQAFGEALKNVVVLGDLSCDNCLAT
jgi:hypothetical protein